ncbi:hypothetical protein LXL04_005132 [Taraxacum kok-saghyz]
MLKMAMLSSTSASIHRLASSSPSISIPLPIPIPPVPSSVSQFAKSTTTSSKNRGFCSTFAIRKPNQLDILRDEETDMAEEEVGGGSESVLYSISPLPLLLIAALPGGNPIDATPVHCCFLILVAFFSRLVNINPQCSNYSLHALLQFFL